MGPKLLVSLALLSQPTPWGVGQSRTSPYREVIDRVVAMPADADLQSRAARLGLNLLNVLWEDVGRAAGSALGPNISDVCRRSSESAEI